MPPGKGRPKRRPSQAVAKTVAKRRKLTLGQGKPTNPGDLRGIVVNKASGVMRSLWPLAATFLSLYSHWYRQKNDCALLTDKQKAALDHLLPPVKYKPIVSKSQVAALLGISRNSVAPALIKVASSLLYCDRMQMMVLSRTVGNVVPADSLLEYDESVQSDETPLSVTRRSASDLTPPAWAADVYTDELPPIVPWHDDWRTNSSCHRRGTAINSKILQSEQLFSMLFCVGNRFCEIFGNILTFPQLLDRTTGECLKKADQLRGCSSEEATKFKVANRFALHDRAAQNDKSERSVMEEPDKAG